MTTTTAPTFVPRPTTSTYPSVPASALIEVGPAVLVGGGERPEFEQHTVFADGDVVGAVFRPTEVDPERGDRWFAKSRGGQTVALPFRRREAAAYAAADGFFAQEGHGTL